MTLTMAPIGTCGPPNAARAAPSRRAGFPQGIMLLLPITMAVMGVSVLTPVVHLLLAHFNNVPNHEYLVMGGVVTMPSIWVLLMSAPAGWVADRFGRRKVLILSMVAYAFVGVAPVFLDNLYAIIVSRVGVGICEAVVMTVTTTMIGDYFQGRARERWLASQTAVASVAASGITYLGGQLGAAYGWRGPFYLYVYSLVLVVGVMKLIWEPTGEEKGVVSGSAAGAAQYTEFPWARLLGICAVTLLGSISFYTVITKNAEALVVLGVSDPARIGTLSTIATIGVPLGTFIYWGLSRLPISWLLAVDFALIGLGFCCMGRAADPTAYVWGSFINQVGCGLVLPSLLVWATRGLAFGIRGKGTGMWTAAFTIGQFLSGMIITALSKPLGGLLPTLSTMGGLNLAVAAGAALAGLILRQRAARR
jgi:predicted MFS family arabinose efflux permease